VFFNRTKRWNDD